MARCYFGFKSEVIDFISTHLRRHPLRGDFFIFIFLSNLFHLSLLLTAFSTQFQKRQGAIFLFYQFYDHEVCWINEDEIRLVCLQ